MNEELLEGPLFQLLVLLVLRTEVLSQSLITHHSSLPELVETSTSCSLARTRTIRPGELSGLPDPPHISMLANIEHFNVERCTFKR